MGFLTAGSDMERWLLVGFTATIATVVAVWLWREDGTTSEREVTWGQSDRATIGDDPETLSGMLPYPSVGFTETPTGELAELVTNEAQDCAPLHKQNTNPH